MPGKHKNLTMSFRPNEWEKAQIEERAKLSGLYKKDFIIRSCIYDDIIFVGTKENVERIIGELQIMEAVIKDIYERMYNGEVPLKKDDYSEMKDDFLALILTVVDVLKGAGHLFQSKKES